MRRATKELGEPGATQEGDVREQKGLNHSPGWSLHFWVFIGHNSCLLDWCSTQRSEKLILQTLIFTLDLSRELRFSVEVDFRNLQNQSPSGSAVRLIPKSNLCISAKFLGNMVQALNICHRHVRFWFYLHFSSTPSEKPLCWRLLIYSPLLDPNLPTSSEGAT